MPDLDYVTLVGRFGIVVGDGADPDDEPDVIWCDEGEIRLVPLNGEVKIAGASPVPWTAGIAVVDASIDTDGYLSWRGKQFIQLVDLTSDKVNPTIPANKATHRVEFRNIKADSVPVTLTSATVRIAADTVDIVTGTCDLTKLLPVQTGNPTPIYSGPRGTGITDIVQPTPTTMALELTDGTTTDPIDLPVGPGGSPEGIALAINDDDGPAGEAVAAKIATDALVKTGAQTVAGVKSFTDGLKVGDAGNRLVQIPGTDTMQIQGSTYIAGRFGVNGGGSPRIPAVITSTVDGAALPSDQLANKVAFAVNPVFKGGFSAEAGRGAPDPGFLFGSNVFVTTGATIGDLAGITDLYGTLHEVHNYTPNSNLNVLLGAQSEGNNEGVGSTVGTGYSHRVKGYAARHGVTVNAISLYVGSPYTENEGTITGVNEALHVGGTAPSYFGGNVSLDNRKLDAGTTSSAVVRARFLVASDDATTKIQQAAVTAYPSAATSVGIIVQGFAAQTGDLQRWQDAGGVIKASMSAGGILYANGGVKAGSSSNPALDTTDGVGVKVLQTGAANRALRVQAAASGTADLTTWLNSGGGDLFAITASGAPRWNAAALAQTTVGAGGAASALPAAPTKYLKVIDSTGATLVIPAYAAA